MAYSSVDITDDLMYLTFDYIHSTDWTVDTMGDEYVFNVLNAYVDVERDYVLEFAMVKVMNRDSLKHLLKVLKIHRNIKDIVSFRPVNYGYPKYILTVLRGDALDSTRYTAHALGGIEVKAIYEGGIEHWGFIFPTENSVRAFLTMVSRRGSVGKVKIKEVDLDNLLADSLKKASLILTSSEFKVLSIAYNRGFFEVPRRVKLDELARELGLSKSTVDGYIREGVRKILGFIFEDDI